MKVLVEMVVTESVEVLSLDYKNLMLIDKDILAKQIVEDAETIHLLRQPSESFADGVKKIAEEIDLNAQVSEAFAIDAAKIHKANHTNDGPIGRKDPNARSIYHNVSWYSGSKMWGAGVSIKGKTHSLSMFVDEVDAALAVDAFLDEIKDTKRPRNRAEFPEVMEAYKLNNKD